MHGEDGRQKCLHHDIVCNEDLKKQKRRLEDLRQLLKDSTPLTARPVWRNVNELRQHCRLRVSSNIESEKVNKMSEADLQDFLFAKTDGGCKLGPELTRGVRSCNIRLVQRELSVRKLVVEGTDDEKRQRLQTRLQLEEWLGPEAEHLDDRFDSNAWGPMYDPSRRLIDALHLCMCGNEQMVHMWKLQFLERHGGKENGQQYLADLDGLLREMGGMRETWKHQWSKKDPEVLAKSGFPYDESKKLFNRQNLENGTLKSVLDGCFWRWYKGV